MDKFRNEYIRGTAQVGKVGEKTREARLRWYGHLRSKYFGYIGRRILRMALPGKRKRGRPKRRFMDVVKEEGRKEGTYLFDQTTIQYIFMKMQWSRDCR